MADTYSRAASRYERYILPFFLPMAETLTEAIGIVRGSHILDLASGGGAVLDALEKHEPARLVAGDLAPGALTAARLRHPRGEYVLLDLESGLPFADGVFDAITCSFGLNHLADPAAALARWKPLLKPGGRLGFTSWEETSASPLGDLYDRAVAELVGTKDLDWEPQFDQMIEKALAALRSARGIEQLLQGAGYEPLEVARYPLEFSFSSPGDYVDYRLAWGTDADVAAPLGAGARDIIANRVAALMSEETPLSWTRHYFVAVAE
jgi:ubiquinone/menaquinone biosynthesis C-methylase UbiE